MILFRIADKKYKDDLSGTGAKLIGGRWNSPGLPALYTSEHASLAALEIIVHVNKPEKFQNLFLLAVELPDSAETAVIDEEKLKKNWQNEFEYTRFIGNSFLKANGSLLLSVPSVLLPFENNIIINPTHGDFKKLKITYSKPIDFDNRFLK
jgi:RES domain-containing protein